MLDDRTLAELMDSIDRMDRSQLAEMMGSMDAEDVAFFKGYVQGYSTAVEHLQMAAADGMLSPPRGEQTSLQPYEDAI